MIYSRILSDDLLIILVHKSVVENRIPVILVEGSGGCCDLFAKCSQFYTDYCPKMKSLNSKLLTSEEEEQIKIKLREKFQLIDEKLNSGSRLNLSNENDSTDYFQLIYECLSTGHRFVNFLDLKIQTHLDTDLDLAILQALINSTRITRSERIHSLLRCLVTKENDLSEMNIDRKREQIDLAFEWKRIDLMRNLILNDDYDWKVKIFFFSLP